MKYRGIVILIIIIVVLYFIRQRIKVSFTIKDSNVIKKIKAFQYVIEFAEHSNIDNENYYKHFGGSKTYNTNAHPNKLIKLSGYKSTAYGRFQYIFSTWQWLAAKYGVTNITPESQNYINERHLIELGVSDALENDDFSKALKIASKQWASLPYSSAGQPRKTESELYTIYNRYLN